MDSVVIDEKRFISSKRAAELAGYTPDYVGQLCRARKIEARLIGRSWYVAEDSILAHKEKKSAPNEMEKRKSLREKEVAVLVSDIEEDVVEEEGGDDDDKRSNAVIEGADDDAAVDSGVGKDDEDERNENEGGNIGSEEMRKTEEGSVFSLTRDDLRAEEDRAYRYGNVLDNSQPTSPLRHNHSRQSDLSESDDANISWDKNERDDTALQAFGSHAYVHELEPLVADRARHLEEFKERVGEEEESFTDDVLDMSVGRDGPETAGFPFKSVVVLLIALVFAFGMSTFFVGNKTRYRVEDRGFRVTSEGIVFQGMYTIKKQTVPNVSR